MFHTYGCMRQILQASIASLSDSVAIHAMPCVSSFVPTSVVDGRPVQPSGGYAHELGVLRRTIRPRYASLPSVAYAEKYVKPVVSDFDTFTVASTGVKYEMLPDDQGELMLWIPILCLPV